MRIITDVKEAQFLLHANEIAFDIETNTAAPHKDWGTNYGLSYCTDITWVSFYAKGYPAVARKMRGIPDEEYQEKSEFLRNVLSRQGITIIAHNATFDLRNLGGHHHFVLPIGTNVWDTMVFSNLLLMGARQNKLHGLEELLHEHNLISYNEELSIDGVQYSEVSFIKEMKKNRAILHLLDKETSEKVLFYVAFDSITAFRLYELQKALVVSHSSPSDVPKLKWQELTEEGRTWKIETEIWRAKSKHKYASTKNWSALGELVIWEQKISRWSANAAIRGVKFNKEWSQQHMKLLIGEYEESLQTIESIYRNYLTEEEMLDVSDLVYWEYVYEATMAGSKVYSRERFPFLRPHTANITPYYKETPVVGGESLDHWLMKNDQYYYDPIHAEVPVMDWTDEEGERFIEFRLFKPCLEMWFEEKYAQEEHGWFLAQIAAEWYRTALLERKEEVFDKVVNKNKFKPFYTFCIAKAPLPSNEDFISDSYLLSGELKAFAEDGGEANFLYLAMRDSKLSMAEDSLVFYHKALWTLSGEDIEYKHYKHPILLPFINALTNKSKFNRIKEFWRHAERDGRIHSMITRKTNTGRMASSQMNLQNLDMDNYKGYLMSDDADHVLIGVDVSNAENYFAAMTFGDSALARACVYGDFHETMARAYWGDELISRLKETDYEGAFKKARSRGKAVTFGGAYGAGYKKIARMVGCSQEEAQELLANRDMTFPDYARGKQLVSQRAESCYKDGFRPAFTTLWTGRRIAVPYIAYMKKTMHADGSITEKWVETLTAYKAINYLQQGGVGELILRAQVLAEEEFEKRGWLTSHIPLQVHDEIIAHVHKDVALEAAHLIAKIILNVVPEQYRKRTNPEVRFLANFGAENKKKWGFNPLVEYPVDTTKFANAWGVWDMPEGESATPLWIDGDMGKQFDEPVMEQYDEMVATTINVAPMDRWAELQRYVQNTDREFSVLQKHLEPVVLNINGNERGPFSFPNKMNLLQHLHHNGHDATQLYWGVFQDLGYFLDAVDGLKEWYEKNKPE